MKRKKSLKKPLSKKQKKTTYKNFDNIKKYCKVKDHCHYTGKYIGVVYNICNLRYL